MSNKNKNLLNERTVRRFMKLAALQPISNNFIKETFQEELEEVESNEEAENLEEMGGYGAREDDAPADEPEEATPEPEAEEDGGAPGMEQFAKDVAQALADAIESASNGTVSMSVEGDEEPASEMDMDPEAEEGDAEEAPMDMEMPEEEEEEEEMQMEASEDEESLEEDFEISTATQEEIVQEVYNRIAKKILKATIGK